jgi:hypothetical protein
VGHNDASAFILTNAITKQQGNTITGTGGTNADLTENKSVQVTLGHSANQIVL